MSGTINLAFTQQFDMDGVPLSGGLLYFFAAGTTTPQSAFQDTSLTIVHPNPIVLDASGRVPMFYLADGFIKIRLTDKNGVTIIAADQLLVIGPSSGGGGGGGTPGDVTQVLKTGDIKARYDTLALDGFVRCNGLSIGNVGSGATERQEAGVQPLFEYLWPFIPAGSPPATGIRLDGFAKGANAIADFGAGRRMFIPDLRGRTIAGLDDMGNPTPAGRLTGANLGTIGSPVSPIVLGNAGGNQATALATENMVSHSHSVSGTGHTHNLNSSSLATMGIQNPRDHVHRYTELDVTASNVGAPSGSSVITAVAFSNSFTRSTATQEGAQDHSHVLSGTTETATPSMTADAISAMTAAQFSIVTPTMVLTFYMKI